MDKKNVLILCGGGGTEHDISLISAKYLEDKLLSLDSYIIYFLVLDTDHVFTDKGGDVFELGNKCIIDTKKNKTEIDIVIPCIHGTPGETGDIQSMLEYYELPYVGSGPEASKLCFNKISTKLWLERMGIQTTPFTFLAEPNIADLKEFHEEHETLFIKPSNQGSSVGCYKINKLDEDTEKKLQTVFTLSPYALIEKGLKARELEVSVFTYQGKIHATDPGEILAPYTEDSFYTYEEKYDPASHTTTVVNAKDLTKDQLVQIKEWAIKAYQTLKVRHLARVDFFLADNGEIYLNEINTFPGLTPISMFPKMMENYGVRFQDFLKDTIQSSIKN